MNDCQTCNELREMAEMATRMDYRAGREFYARLVEHQTQCHVWHVATVKETRPAKIAT